MTPVPFSDPGAVGASLLDRATNPPRPFREWDRFRASITPTSGLYAMYELADMDAPVYIGMALGKRGLRARLAEHWNLGMNVVGDQLKYYIAVKKLGLPADKAQLKRDHRAIHQSIQDYLARCALQWLAVEDDDLTRMAERMLQARYRSALNETSRPTAGG